MNKVGQTVGSELHSANERTVINMKFNILLNSINDVKNFVNAANSCDFDVDLTSGRYVVDAKSIMGIFSLDLSKPIEVTAPESGADAFAEAVKSFIV